MKPENRPHPRVTGALNAPADPHAHESVVLTINIGHPVALPAAPHFYCCLCAERIPVVSAGDSATRGACFW